MATTFVTSAQGTIINGTQVWFQLVTDDGRRFDVDVNLWDDPSGRIGFHARFGLPERSEVRVEAHHLDDIESIAVPVAVQNQNQQIQYVHGEVYPPAPTFRHEICARCEGSGRERLSLVPCTVCEGTGRSTNADEIDVPALIKRLENRAADETWSANAARREMSQLLREAAQALRAKTSSSSAPLCR